MARFLPLGQRLLWVYLTQFLFSSVFGIQPCYLPKLDSPLSSDFSNLWVALAAEFLSLNFHAALKLPPWLYEILPAIELASANMRI